MKICYDKIDDVQRPQLLNVPQFETVYICPGRKANRSGGDILVGRLESRKTCHPADKPALKQNMYYYLKLKGLIVKALGRDEPVTLEVRSAKEWK